MKTILQMMFVLNSFQSTLVIIIHNCFLNQLNQPLILQQCLLMLLFITPFSKWCARVIRYLILQIIKHSKILIVLSLRLYFSSKLNAFVLAILFCQLPSNLSLYLFLYIYLTLVRPIHIYFDNHLFNLPQVLDFLQIVKL